MKMLGSRRDGDYVYHIVEMTDEERDALLSLSDIVSDERVYTIEDVNFSVDSVWAKLVEALEVVKRQEILLNELAEQTKLRK